MTSERNAVPERMQCMEVWGGNSPVQRSFETAGLQLWLHSHPFEQAVRGGDVYYISSCASGRITRLLLADVSGHGEGVGALAVGLRDLMRQNVNVIQQTRFVSEMNRQFAEQPENAAFATAVVCTFFAPTRSLQICNAGHPPPMLFRAPQGRWFSVPEVASIERGAGFTDTPLGIVEHADYTRIDTRLSQGDMVLCVSDAFTESQWASGELLGSDGLLRMVEDVDTSQAAEVIPGLIDRIVREHRGNLAHDDSTALLFRADGSKVSLTDNLLAPFRLLRRVRDGTTLQT